MRLRALLHQFHNKVAKQHFSARDFEYSGTTGQTSKGGSRFLGLSQQWLYLNL
jgi:hypothetical protein